MIILPISNRDLLRSIMARVPAAGVRFGDARLQEAVEDEILGLCRVDIVTCGEIVETVLIYDTDGTVRPHTTTRQRHEVRIEYADPELQFVKALEWGLSR